GAYVKGNIGNFDYRAVEGMVNIPILDDVLAMRVVASQDKRDGWVKNIQTGKKLNERDFETIRASLLFTPNDKLENSTVYSYENSETLGAVNSLHAYNPNGMAALLFGPLFYELADEAIALGRDKIRIDYEGGQERKASFLSNTTSYDISESLTFKNIFGFQELQSSTGINMSGVALPLIYLGVEGSRRMPSNRMYSNELQFLYSDPGGSFDLVTGLFWSRQEPGKKGIPTQSIKVGFPGPLTRNTSVAKSIAPYAQLTFPLSSIVEGLSFTAGVRYTKDERDSTQRRSVGGVETVTEVSGEWSDYNWEATINYQVNDDLLAYIAHRHGFKGGAFNPSALDPALVMVEPEYVDDV